RAASWNRCAGLLRNPGRARAAKAIPGAVDPLREPAEHTPSRTRLPMTASSRSRLPGVLIALASAAALCCLFCLIYGRTASGGYAGSVAFLPALTATCNAVTTLLIVRGLMAIGRGHREARRRRMLGAFATSALFLAGY